MNAETYRLLDICAAIGEVIEANFEEPVWIEADITSLSARTNGHCYLELGDNGDDGQEAKMRGTIWRNRYVAISHYFKIQSGQELQRGLRIRLRAQVSYHLTYGLSLNIIDIDPDFTLGAHKQRREAIIAKLMVEGHLDTQKSLKLNKTLQRIAIISSETAAGYQDFVHHLNSNSYAFGFQLSLFPAIMQGADVEVSIAAHLTYLVTKKNEFDCIVIIRGGGAEADLFGFDSYALGVAIAQSPIPVLTGIGHEKDTTVPDFAAHARHKTPTAVAVYLLDHNRQALAEVEEILLRLSQWVTSELQNAQTLLGANRHQMQLAGRLALERLKQKCTANTIRVQQAIATATKPQHTNLDLIQAKIEGRNPLKLLKLGFALVRHNGKLVKSVAQLRGIKNLDIEVVDGVEKVFLQHK